MITQQTRRRRGRRIRQARRAIRYAPQLQRGYGVVTVDISPNVDGFSVALDRTIRAMEATAAQLRLLDSALGAPQARPLLHNGRKHR